MSQLNNGEVCCFRSIPTRHSRGSVRRGIMEQHAEGGHHGHTLDDDLGTVYGRCLHLGRAALLVARAHDMGRATGQRSGGTGVMGRSLADGGP